MDALKRMIGDLVVLDTGSPIVYIGRLKEITELTFVLTETDMHDCRDGHANKERYLIEAHDDGLQANRHEIVVMRSVVISASRLADVVAE